MNYRHALQCLYNQDMVREKEWKSAKDVIAVGLAARTL
jgi:hypothetical protein